MTRYYTLPVHLLRITVTILRFFMMHITSNSTIMSEQLSGNSHCGKRLRDCLHPRNRSNSAVVPLTAIPMRPLHSRQLPPAHGMPADVLYGYCSPSAI